MLEQARGKHVYDELTHGELVAHLQQHPARLRRRRLGRHAGVLRRASRGSRPRPPARCGRAAWSSSRSKRPQPTTETFHLEVHGRYCHAAPYVARVLSEAGLAPHIDRDVLRNESGRPVAGLVVRARKARATRVADGTPVMTITTPLGDDVLLFHGMHAREELGRLGEFHVDLLSPQGDIDLDEILGKNVTVQLALPDDSRAALQRLRDALLAGRPPRALLPLPRRASSPWLWFLTRTTDCRIFQEMTVPDILQAGVRRPRHGRRRVRADRRRTGSGPTACSTARPTSTSSAG